MNPPSIQNAVIVTACSTIQLNAEGFICVSTREDASIDKEEVDRISSAIIRLTKSEPCFLLVVPSIGSHADAETREYAAKTRSIGKHIIAEAVVVANLALRILANFYIKFSKPQHKIRVFASETEASQWLKNEKGLYESKAVSL